MITVFIKTYGCQANVADSVHLAGCLKGLGCTLVDTEDQADLIIVNSCAIREKAEHKMFSYLGELVEHKKNKPYLAIGVIGCVASYRKEEFFKRFDHVSFVSGAREGLETFKANLVDIIESVATKKSLYVLPGKQEQVQDNSLGWQFRRSMINIMRGCNNYCSYCIVPFTTGRERSFSMNDIVEQVARDVRAGSKEVTLLGQNVNSYKDPETGLGFATLLERVAQIDGEFWVRFVSPHPKDMTADVIDTIAAYNQKLCAFIHLPIQSGSDKILQLMNRTYSVETYLDQVAMIRERLPHATITTDIIVGFPGETERDYQATLDVVKRVRFAMIFSFIYSPRKYTSAAQLQDSCPDEVKHERLQTLHALHREIGTQVNKELVGKTVLVLLESRQSQDLSWGRTEGNVRVLVSGGALELNQFVSVRVTKTRLSDVRGDLI
ncbi:tRNA (N6-isopentenyl adenosine(37)-C2)-methylthiotransferase MiaB [Candidatus Dependentiae bacterium]|nr:tRNA (N6-isopentenyl adenosine(37)-C2)-methylthiotransferase MiaB [Candidatus Dependentiae bacterium]